MKMCKTTRNRILVISALMVGASLVAFAATGARAWTRFKSQETEAVNQHSDLDELFGDTGLNQAHGEAGKIDNRFALGLFPAGFGPAMISVATITGAALAVCAGAWLLTKKELPK